MESNAFLKSTEMKNDFVPASDLGPGDGSMSGVVAVGAGGYNGVIIISSSPSLVSRVWSLRSTWCVLRDGTASAAPTLVALAAASTPFLI